MIERNRDRCTVRGATRHWLLAFSAGLLVASTALGSTTAVDVVFVLDNSGSMRKHDPDFLTRAAVMNFADALARDPETDGRVGIVLFDGDARLIQSLIPITDSDARRLLASPLSALDFSGQRTNSPTGIERALYELRQKGRAEAQQVIIFLTDGKIDTGNARGDLEKARWLREDLAEESLAKDIRIFGIAFTESADYQLIQAVALKTRASYYRAFEASQLDSVVTDILAQIADSGESIVATGQPTPALVADPAPRPVAAPATPEPGERGFGLLGLLPVAILLVAGSLMWRRRSTDRLDTKSAAQSSADPDRKAPAAQLLDIGGRLGETGSSIPLQLGRTLIGRDPHNDIILNDDTISSEHALIEVRKGRYWVEDRRSTNGTQVGDDRLRPGQPIQLKGGDHIRFAEIDLMFVLTGYVPGGDTVFLPSSTQAQNGSESDSPNAAEASEARPADTDRGDVGSLGWQEVTEPHLPENRSTTNAAKLPASTASNGPPDLNPHDPTVEAPGEARQASTAESYRACLDSHLDRVEEISPAFASFVARGFDEEMRGALSIAAAELIQDAQVARRVQQRAYSAAGIRYLICAVPDPIDQARNWFMEAYGGFTRLLAEALQGDSFQSDHCEILAVLSFGRGTAKNAAAWVSLSIVPDEGQDSQIDLLSYEFLSDEERRAMQSDADSEASRSGLA